MARPVLLAVIEHPDGDIYVGNAMYCTKNTDTPANTLFDERISDAEYERAVTFPWWSRSATTTPVKFLDLYNRDGRYDTNIDDEWRDVAVTLYLVEELAAFSTAEVVGYILVEKIETPSPDIFRLNGYSFLELADKPITTNYSDTITNTQFRNKARPICLGSVRWALPINRTLNDPAGSQRGVYDIADGYIERIDSVRHRGELQVESNAPLVTNSSPRYFVSVADGAYGFVWREQLYKLAAHVEGQLRIGAQLLLETTFTASWATYWTSDVSDGTATQGSGLVTITSFGAGDNLIYQNITTVVDAVYLVEIIVDATSAGVWNILQDRTVIRELEYVDAETVTATFVATGTTTEIGVGFLSGATGDFTIQSVRCYRAYRIDCLSEIVRFVAGRVGIPTANFNLTALSSYDTTRLAFYSTEEVTGARLLKLAADSVGVGLFQDSAGVVTCVALADPSGMTEDFTFYEIDIDGDVSFEPDEAPGLAMRMIFARNYNVHSLDDVAGLNPATAGNAQLREELQREYRTVLTGETTHSAYADAADREPLESLTHDETEAQGAINYPVELYGNRRGFYSFRARTFTISPHTINPGHVIKLYNRRYGLTAGKKLIVVYAKSSFLRGAIDLVLWG